VARVRLMTLLSPIPALVLDPMCLCATGLSEQKQFQVHPDLGIARPAKEFRDAGIKGMELERIQSHCGDLWVWSGGVTRCSKSVGRPLDLW
jgi:hypothetical protein